MSIAPRFMLTVATLALLAAPGASQTPSADAAAKAVNAVSETAIDRHWRVLVHDSMEGRGAGTRGEQRAARYIAAQFQRLRLQPTGDSGTYFQRFAIRSKRTADSTTALNVVGCLPGSAGTTEFALMGAHYDAYGIGPAVNGDSIYNGALDNASGTAVMLSVAEALVASSAKTRRGICFAAFGAEERGLLGSRAYVTALRDTASVIAMLNIDGANLWGKTQDMAVLGAELSTLGADFQRAAAAEGLTVTVPENEVRAGFFSRSDQFSFAKAGVPALFFRRGKALVNGGVEAWEKNWAEYYGQGGRYHKPSDEILDWYNMTGAAQQARVAIRVLLDITNGQDRPKWNEGISFGKTNTP